MLGAFVDQSSIHHQQTLRNGNGLCDEFVIASIPESFGEVIDVSELFELRNDCAIGIDRLKSACLVDAGSYLFRTELRQRKRSIDFFMLGRYVEAIAFGVSAKSLERHHRSDQLSQIVVIFDKGIG